MATAPEATAPQQTAPQRTASQQTAPQRTASQQTAPQQTASQQTAPRQTAPEATASHAASARGAGQRRRPELAAFLRGRRARITPEDVGMPPGPRRRTPGLRREEVAALAGVGVTWYTWLEQGRPINASPQVLDAVARTLRLAEHEREHMYQLAGVPYAGEPKPRARAVSPEVQAVLDAVDPLPASIYNARFDLLAFNPAYWSLFFGGTGRWADTVDGEWHNMLWALFTGSQEDCPLVFRREELGVMVATFRAGYGRHVGEPSWESFIRRLCSASEEFAEMWASGDVVPPGPRVKTFRHPEVGEVRLRSVSMTVHGIPEARMVVYTPADEPSERCVAALRRADGSEPPSASGGRRASVSCAAAEGPRRSA